MSEGIEASSSELRAGYITREDVIARKLVELAEEGDLKAIEMRLKQTSPEGLLARARRTGPAADARP